MKKKYSRWLVVLLVIITLTVLGLSLDLIGYARTGHGDFCIQCGATRHREKLMLEFCRVRIPIISTDRIKTSPLTGAWANYCGGCSHDWTFHYSWQRSLAGGGYNACGFPAFDYPVGAVPESLAGAIEALDDQESRTAALHAIGHRGNLLRHIAAGALHELHSQAEANRQTFKPAQWWTANSNLFLIETNSVAARQFLDRLDSQTDAWIEYAVDESRELMRRIEFRQSQEAKGK